MSKTWLKWTVGGVAAGLGLYGWHRWQVARNGPLGFLAAPHRFLKYAITLEAQQVPLYELLAGQAELNSQPHFAVGLRKAKDVEQQHLDRLSMHAARFDIDTAPWARLGHRFGLISGGLLTLFDTRLGLKVIAAIETKAAQDYREAYKHLTDSELKALYLRNQVDEEAHYTWAKEMLEQY